MLEESQPRPSSPSPAEVRQARQAAGLTQREAGALVHVSWSTVKAWEAGRFRMPPDRWELMQQKLAGITAEQLLRARLDDARRRFRQELRVVSGGSVGSSSVGTETRGPEYAELFRTALELAQPRPTLKQIADWCGFSVHTLRGWLKPPSSQSHRPMPRYALRLVLWELAARDDGQDWGALLRACR